MNKKLITGTITLAALLGVGASANIGANANSISQTAQAEEQQGIPAKDANSDAYYTQFANEAQKYHPQTVPAYIHGKQAPDGWGQFYANGNKFDADNGEVKVNGQRVSNQQALTDLNGNGEQNSESTNGNGNMYQNSNTLPQTSETKNAKDVALAGLSALAASVALIGADPAKEAIKNKIVDRRLKYGI